MSRNASSSSPLLLRLEIRRLSDAFRQPRPAAWLGALLPAALAAGALWLAADSVRPDVSTGDGVILLGLLASGPVALQAYTLLFRPADDAFLRRLGIDARALFAVRALRLLLLALAVVLALMIPFIATRRPILEPLGIALAAALVSWAASLLTHADAARRIAAGMRPRLPGSQGFDMELVKASDLLYAPLWPLMAGAAAATFAAAPVGAMPLRIAAVALAAAAMVPLAMRTFARALPRFAPHAGELAYAPPPDATGGELVIGRGIARALPRRAQAVRARDAVVVGRRYRWTSRTAWPVAIVAALVILRAGGDAAVRTWVTLACGALLVAQAAAVVALGRSERGRTRWMDRALGLRPADRLLGRWATAFGVALAVALPLAIAWWIGVDGGRGWIWLAAGAAAALAASSASLAAAGR
ncbi:MAG TPA: hypothetical protein VF092_15385 [Longimicrobium sp.]